MSSGEDTLSWMLELDSKINGEILPKLDAIERALIKLQPAAAGAGTKLDDVDEAATKAGTGFSKLAGSAKGASDGVEKVGTESGKSKEKLTGLEAELSRVEKQLADLKAHPETFKKLTEASKELSEHQKKLGGESKAVEVEFGKIGGVNLGNVFKGLSGAGFEGIFTVGISEGVEMLVEGFETAYEIAEKIADSLIDFAKDGIKVAAKEQRTQISFKALLGDEGGDEALEYIEHITKAGELTDVELKKVTQDLIGAGFRGKELLNMIPAVLDAGAIKGGGMEAIDTAVNAFEMIKTTGDVSARQLRAFGIEESAIWKQLSKDTGDSVGEVQKKLAAHGYAWQTTTKAIKEQIMEISGGPLGTMAEKMGGTVDAQMHKIGDIPDMYMQKFAQSKGFASWGSLLNQLAKELDPDSPFGHEMQAGLTGIFDTLMSVFGGKDDLVAGIKDGLREAIPIVRALAEAFVYLAEMAKVAVGWIGDSIDLARSAVDLADRFGLDKSKDHTASHVIGGGGLTESEVDKSGGVGGNATPRELGENIGKALVEGMNVGIFDAGFLLDIGTAGLSKRAEDGVKKGLEIHSPSRKFAALGMMTGEGFMAGLTDSIDTEQAISVPGSGMTGAQLGGNLIPRGGGSGGGSAHVTLQVEVNVNGVPSDELADQVAQRIVDIVPSALESAAEQLALELGSGS